MGPSGQDEIRRALETNAVKAKADADRFAKRRDEKPFWRWRRRKLISKAVLRAEEQEQAARRLLEEAGDERPT